MVGDGMVEKAIERVIEKTDLDPGEVNRNITKVMATMQKANEQFQDMDKHVNKLLSASEDLDSTGTEMAQASVEVAKASQGLAKSVQELNETQQEMSEDIEDLQDTLERLNQYMPEEDE